MIRLIKKYLFKTKYIEVANFIKGKDKRCNKSTNLYIGINNLNNEQVIELLENCFDLKVDEKILSQRFEVLNKKNFSNKMINVNMNIYKEHYIRNKSLDAIIMGNNFKKSVHHMCGFEYIDTIVIDNKIVIK